MARRDVIRIYPGSRSGHHRNSHLLFRWLWTGRVADESSEIKAVCKRLSLDNSIP